MDNYLHAPEFGSLLKRSLTATNGRNKSNPFPFCLLPSASCLLPLQRIRIFGQ
ncbi:MAG: hypothetical protein F6K41_28365 [Symploca sp. SIO3E6]|nr:hypothetical protein [Caldora sp. SIO3E6]